MATAPAQIVPRTAAHFQTNGDIRGCFPLEWRPPPDERILPMAGEWRMPNDECLKNDEF
jgi:hypothetical protein